MKYDNNKYYTPNWLIKETIKIIKEKIIDDITEVIEPSAGDGRFYTYLQDLSKNIIMYDIEPDCENVIKQDFLTLNLKYKKGRIIVGNPPFGTRGNLYKKFIIKASKICDYIIFILPTSQLNNNIFFKTRCKLIYSCFLDDIKFDTVDGEHLVKTCLNIYDCKKNDNEKYNFSFLSNDLKLRTCKNKETKTIINNNEKYDFYINSYGYYQGKKFFNINDYSNFVCVKIINENKRESLELFFENFYINYKDEIFNINKNGNSITVNKNFILKKLKKDFYKLNK